jgi:protein-L-isoaspartate(D-aspartate) O-methyltransferase
MNNDLELARFNMVEQQIRPWDVLDTKVLDLLHKVKREAFVPPAYSALAFADLEIPIGEGEKMLSPKLEARILQELAVQPEDRILEVGTGSGYLTALLASQGAHVYSVDIVDAFIKIAGERLAQHGLRNVTLEHGDAARGWNKHGPYDVIVLTGSVPVLADSFQQSLNAGGRLFAVVGEEPVMEAQLITCAGAGMPGAFNTASLFETCVPALRNAPQRTRFSF